MGENVKKPLLIQGGRVIDPSQGLDTVADVLVEGGKVKAIGRDLPLPPSAQALDATGLLVCPGFVDLHTHLREPGFEQRETIATGTRAAAQGGFTAVCAMPNTVPPVDTAGALEWVQRKGQEEGFVRVLPIACISQRREGKALVEMAELASAGAVGFSDDGDPVSDPFLMRMALTYAAPLGLPVINHPEEKGLSRGGQVNEGWAASRLGLKGIPAEGEESMVARDIALCRLTGGRLHLAHLSTAGSVELVRRAKEEGLSVTAEVNPHHLVLTEEWLLGRRGEGGPFAPLTAEAYDTNCKVYPPLRTRRDMEALVQALKEGVIDAIATDHAPHTAVEKACTFDEAAFGISGLETAFSLLHTGLVQPGLVPLTTLVKRLTMGPARVLGRKEMGTLKPGAPADLTLIDLSREWEVRGEELASKGKNTPLVGMRLKGKAVATLVDGKVVFVEEVWGNHLFAKKVVPPESPSRKRGRGG